jgi:DNA modification methylase
MKFPSAVIQMWDIKRVVPNANNPRRHPKKQIKKLARSLRKFGFVRPLVVDQNGVLITGNAVLSAALLSELEKVPVLVVDYLTDSEKRAYTIADNQLALTADWDEQKLGEELAALAAELFEMEVIGFDPRELDQLMARLGAELGNTDGDAVPALSEFTTSVLDDIWCLDLHRVLCGDSTSRRAYEQVMEGAQAAMTFCDFPYNVNLEQKTTAGLRRITNDNLGQGFEQFLYDACLHIVAVTDGAIYIFMSSSELPTLQTAFTRAGGHWSDTLIWSKDHFTLGRSDYQRQYEPFLYGWRQGAKHFWCGDRNQGNVWQVPKPRVNDLHPTMKPIELVERAIRNSSQEGDVVLDPFAGSGSTLIACQRTGRSARLIELEPQYVDVIVRRWQEFTGRSATLEGHGGTFAEVAHERLRKAA